MLLLAGGNRRPEMGRCCRRLKPFLIVFVIILVVWLVYYEVCIGVVGAYQYKNAISDCQTPANEMKDMKDLIRSTHAVLEKLGIRHFLVYGSLWGAMRFKDPLPWDYDFDFGIVGSEFRKVTEIDLKEAFSKAGIHLFYRPYAGNYRVEQGLAGGDLIIFEDWYRNGIMQRIGIESYLLFLHYRKFHCFPAHLIEYPLPVTEFAGVNISIPRGGIEIQKYLYPTNWWKEVKPRGC